MSFAFKWLKQAFEVNTPLRWMGVIHTSAGAVLFQSGCGENKTAAGWFTVWRPFKHPRSGKSLLLLGFGVWFFFLFFVFLHRSRIWNSAQFRCRIEALKVPWILHDLEIPNGLYLPLHSIFLLTVALFKLKSTSAPMEKQQQTIHFQVNLTHAFKWVMAF